MAGFSTRSLHADQSVKLQDAAVAPAISVATTFRRSELPPDADPSFIGDGGFVRTRVAGTFDVRSRIQTGILTPTTTRVEAVLSSLLGGHALVYSSGLGAVFGALLHLQPTVVAITKGYHGCHETIKLYGRNRPGFKVIDLDDDYPQGTLCWLETPLNPTGECRDMEHYAKKAHAAGGKIVVDSTFAPPPLQDPFKWGVDMIMHSATKYFAGHSDALVGVLAVRTNEEWQSLWSDRTYSGSTPGSLESWLLLRSLRTLSVRVERQARTATQLAKWLDGLQRAGEADGVIERVCHASLQEGWSAMSGSDPQLKDGPATFAIYVKTAGQGAAMPHRCKLFAACVTLSEESDVHRTLHRSAASNRSSSSAKSQTQAPIHESVRLETQSSQLTHTVRISVGLEDLADLQADLLQAFAAVKDL